MSLDYLSAKNEASCKIYGRDVNLIDISLQPQNK